jgi:23S rRNA pseudouridine2605 synthase
MAEAGIGSRRACEEIILQGRVEVDGQTVTQLGTKVDPSRQHITVDGQGIRRRRHVYFAVNKPAGVLSTSADESGRLRVIDLIASRERIYTVGRLDKSSEGLILVTNDGDLANRLTHPRFGVDKTYLVRVVGQPTQHQLDQLRRGIRLAEGWARVAELRVRKSLEHCTDLEIVLREGRNREVRRVMAALGHKVILLRRIAIGAVRLGDLPVGAHRELSRAEIQALRHTGAPGASKKAGTRATSARRGLRKAKRLKRSEPSPPTAGPSSSSTRSLDRGGRRTPRRNAGGARRAMEKQKGRRGRSGRR